MKVWLVIEAEQWEGSWPIKVYLNKQSADYCAIQLQNEEDQKENPSLHYYVREIEADLNE